MAGKTSGPIVTIGLEVMAEYTCSVCGKENCLPDTAQVTGTTASILALRRAGKDRDLGGLLPGGIAGAGLSCRCGCGHRECWARMNYSGLDRVRKALLAVLAAAAVAIYLLHGGGSSLVGPLLAVIGLCALALAGSALWQTLHRRARKKELAALPQASLPRLRLRGKPNS